VSISRVTVHTRRGWTLLVTTTPSILHRFLQAQQYMNNKMDIATLTAPLTLLRRLNDMEAFVPRQAITL
jgi:7,8-dihydro-6-hydroxymethylpterin-pyrophosphokinase